MSHQLGGRQAYLPIQIPAANASAAHSRGSRLDLSILDVEPGRIRLLMRVKCPALHDVWATAVVDSPEGKVDSKPEFRGPGEKRSQCEKSEEKDQLNLPLRSCNPDSQRSANPAPRWMDRTRHRRRAAHPSSQDCGHCVRPVLR